MIGGLELSKDAPVIDVGGGGPSMLPGALLDRGFTDITVLDVSSAALERCREYLVERADSITWVNIDITMFKPSRPYVLWHDRATFHFLIDRDDQQTYVSALHQGLEPGGYAIIATFAADSPTQCSGLDVVRWDPVALAEPLGESFALIGQCGDLHQTPWGTRQAFVYCLFRHRG